MNRYATEYPATKIRKSCGTRRGFNIHHQHLEQPCVDCVTWKQADTVWRQRNPGKADQCGTPTGYQRHRRRGETACVECKAAWAASQKEKVAATNRALTRLRRAHREEFRRFYVEELGYEPSIGRPPRKEG